VVKFTIEYVTITWNFKAIPITCSLGASVTCSLYYISSHCKSRLKPLPVSVRNY